MPRTRANSYDASDKVVRRRDSQRRDYYKHRERHRNQMYKYLYGISLVDYGKLLENQKGLCAICGESPQPRKGHITTLVPDHNHITGKVRSLLCNRCNVMLVKIENNLELATKMLDYLKYYES